MYPRGFLLDPNSDTILGGQDKGNGQPRLLISGLGLLMEEDRFFTQAANGKYLARRQGLAPTISGKSLYHGARLAGYPPQELSFGGISSYPRKVGPSKKNSGAVPNLVKVSLV